MGGTYLVPVIAEIFSPFLLKVWMFLTFPIKNTGLFLSKRKWNKRFWETGRIFTNILESGGEYDNSFETLTTLN